MLFLLQHMVPLAVQVCMGVPVAAARMVLLAGRLVLLMDHEEVQASADFEANDYIE